MLFGGRNRGVPLQSSITWSCLEGMKDRKVMAVMAAWWCHRGKM